MCSSQLFAAGAEREKDWFSVGNSTRKAVRYVVKIELKGVPGLVTPVVGKETPDTHIWVFHGEALSYRKSEGPLCAVWRIELVSPAWKINSLSVRDRIPVELCGRFWCAVSVGRSHATCLSSSRKDFSFADGVAVVCA